MTFHKDLHGGDLHDAKFHAGAGSPVGVFTPDVVGLGFFDTVIKQLWMSTGLTNVDWIAVSSYDPFTYTTFAFSTGTPLDFGSLNLGDVVVDVDVMIDVPFNDPAALLAFGLVSSPGTILPSNAIDPLTAGTYNAGADVVVAGVDAFRLQIVPGTSTQGSGRVIATVRKA
jgi:hypothetical protein